MKAIEFESQTHNGVIDVPSQYRAWDNKKVKVILLAEDNVMKEQTTNHPSFSAISINTKGYRFNREEANER